MGALIEDLDSRGIRTKANGRLNGSVRDGIRFGMGALTHLLKEPVLHRRGSLPGRHHRGEHAAQRLTPVDLLTSRRKNDV